MPDKFWKQRLKIQTQSFLQKEDLNFTQAIIW